MCFGHVFGIAWLYLGQPCNGFFDIMKVDAARSLCAPSWVGPSRALLEAPFLFFCWRLRINDNNQRKLKLIAHNWQKCKSINIPYMSLP